MHENGLFGSLEASSAFEVEKKGNEFAISTKEIIQ